MNAIRHAEPSTITLFRVTDSGIGALIFLKIGGLFNVPLVLNIDASLMIFLLVIVVFTYFKVYRTWQESSLSGMIIKLIEGCILSFAILLIMSLFMGILRFTPLIVYFYWLITWCMVIIAARMIFFLWEKEKNAKGIFKHNAVILGINTTTKNLIEWIRKNHWNDINVRRIFDNTSKYNNMYGVPIDTNYESIQSYVKKNNIDIVYISSSDILTDEIKKISQRLSDTTASIYLISDFFSNDFIQNPRVMYHGDLLVYSLRDTPHHGFNYLLKRFVDILFSVIGIVLTSPLLIMAIIGVKLTSPGPIFFQQWRYGLNGNKFKVLKLRTMEVMEDGYVFHQVKENDPRLTRLGKILRKTSIDELPQLFNVLLGNMSLVGPRPHAISMVNEYCEKFPGAMQRHMIKPGITGLAQLYGTRSEVKNLSEVKERLNYDNEYLKNWSLSLDLKIMVYTVFSLVTKGGH
jgi:putative colanic acid biosysnthesis UDP-glucose lipid carrier transferase